MSVIPGIPINQVLRGPDQSYTVANILNAFVRGDTVRVYSFDGTSLVPNEIDHVARRGVEYMFQVVDKEEGFFTCSASQQVLTQKGLVEAKDLNGEHKLIRPTELRPEEIELLERRLVPKRGTDPTADEREFVYAVRLVKEPYNIFTGRAVLEAEKAEDVE